MSEELTREIIGIAQESCWSEIVQFIKRLIATTLINGSEYTLIVINSIINNKSTKEFSRIIKNVKETKILNEINSFENLALYQYTENTSTHVSVSHLNGAVFIIAKYFGPYINHHKYFDFSIHLDGLNDPIFAVRSGKKVDISSLINLIKENKQLIHLEAQKKVKALKSTKSSKKESVKQDGEEKPIEVIIYEKTVGKNAIWNGVETKQYKSWKMKMNQKFKQKTGRNPYYKSHPTQDYKKFLKNILKINNKDSKDTSDYKKKGKGTMQNKTISKKNLSFAKKKVIEKDQLDDYKKDNLEMTIYEKITGKKSYWNGKETKQYQQWKKKMANEFRARTEGNPYYGGNPTNDYKTFLEDRNKIKTYERIKGKNAYWNGKETKQFQQWKRTILKKYIEKSKEKSKTYNDEENNECSKNFLLFLNAL